MVSLIDGRHLIPSHQEAGIEWMPPRSGPTIAAVAVQVSTVPNTSPERFDGRFGYGCENVVREGTRPPRRCSTAHQNRGLATPAWPPTRAGAIFALSAVGGEEGDDRNPDSYPPDHRAGAPQQTGIAPEMTWMGVGGRADAQFEPGQFTDAYVCWPKCGSVLSNQRNPAVGQPAATFRWLCSRRRPCRSDTEESVVEAVRPREKAHRQVKGNARLS